MSSRASRRLSTAIVMMRLLPAYLLIGLLERMLPLRWLARWAWRHPAGPRNREAERRLVAGVLRLGDLIGLPERDCMQRSLLLYRLLSRAGADPMLVLGFRRANDRLLGHAWVIVDGQPLIEPDADLLQFTPALRFGWHGMLLPALETVQDW